MIMKTIEINGIEITPNGSPDCDVELIKQLDDGTIIIGYLMIDQGCQNPCTDQDGMGHIRSLSHRHINSIGADEACELLKTDKMVVPLSYYEHGLCLWDVMHGARIASCPDKQWDQVEFAGIWIPDQCCRDEIKSRSRRKRISYRAAATELAEGCCKEYTAWANGDCWGTIVERFDDEGNYISGDSCFGYIGSEWANEALREMFDGETAGELATACLI